MWIQQPHTSVSEWHWVEASGLPNKMVLHSDSEELPTRAYFRVEMARQLGNHRDQGWPGRCYGCHSRAKHNTWRLKIPRTTFLTVSYLFLVFGEFSLNFLIFPSLLIHRYSSSYRLRVRGEYCQQRSGHLSSEISLGLQVGMFQRLVPGIQRLQHSTV